MGKLIEGRWDCTSCNTKGILGRYRECPNCGNPRGEDVKFYLEDKEDYVSDEEAKKISRNPNWMCDFCGSYNSDEKKKCKSCGAERRENKNYFEVQREKEKKQEERKNINEQRSNNSNNLMNFTEKNSIKNNTTASIIIGLIMLVAIVVAIVSIFKPKEENLKINDFTWERKIDIEEYKTFHESGWNVPKGGRVTSQNREIYDYEQVIDHYVTKTREVEKQRKIGKKKKIKDLGNGYFEEVDGDDIYETYYETEEYEEPVYRDVPIYKIKYYYDIERWTYERSVTTKGNDKEPYWGKENLKDNERVKKKHETYIIQGVTDEKKKKTRKVNVEFKKWKSFQIGQSVKIKTYIGGGTKLKE